MATQLPTPSDGSELTASETVYFHPHLFAREKTLLDAMAVLTSDKKFDTSELAQSILAAAFIDAERTGAIRLAREKASRLFGLRKVDALFVHAGTAPPPPHGSYEARIREAVAQGPLELETVVHRVLGEDHTVPTMMVVGGVLEGLAKRGLVEVREKKQLKLFRTEFFHMPEATRARGAATDGRAVSALLDAWKTRPDWELLQKGIRQGIASRKEASDGPD